MLASRERSGDAQMALGLQISYHLGLFSDKRMSNAIYHDELEVCQVLHQYVSTDPATPTLEGEDANHFLNLLQEVRQALSLRSLSQSFDHSYWTAQAHSATIEHSSVLVESGIATLLYA